MRTRYSYDEICKEVKAHWLNYCKQLLIKEVNSDIEDYVLFYCTDGKSEELPYTLHRRKLYYTPKGRAYFRYNNYRVYLEDCVRYWND